MGTLYYEGRAPVVAQVETGSIDSVDGTPANNDFTVTIGGIAVTVAGVTSAAATAAALLAALQASTHPYFTAVVWTNPSGGNIVGTAAVPGVPFEAALTVTGAGTGAVTDFTTTTANSSPGDVSVGANWSGGAVPSVSDEVVLRDCDVNLCWGLDQVAIDLDKLTIEATFTGRIGLRYNEFATSVDGVTTVETAVEYRTHYWRIESDEVHIGEHYGPGQPNGSDRIKLDLNVHATKVIIHSTSQSTAETGKCAVRLLLTNGANEIYVRDAPGGVGIAVDEPHETSTVSKIHVSADTEESVVEVGEGVTLTTWWSRGGQCFLKSAGTVTAITVKGGALQIEGDFGITTITTEGGTVYPNNAPAAGAAIGTWNHNGGHVDATGSTRARTWTTFKWDKDRGGTFDIDPDYVTLTNEVELV